LYDINSLFYLYIIVDYSICKKDNKLNVGFKMYSKVYMKHFAVPENVGVIENPSFQCEVINKEDGCFDKVKFFVNIEENKVVEAKYQLKACSGTIMAFSLLTSLIIGKVLSDLRKIDFDFLREQVGDLPEKKTHSLRLAVEANNELIKFIEK